MKKTVKLMGMAIMLGAVAFFGSSCKKDTPAATFKLDLPVVEVISVDGDKAYIDFSDGNKMKWNEGDKIMAYNLSTTPSQSVTAVYTITNGVATTSGDFMGNDLGAEQEYGYYAFYPAEKVMNHPLENGIRQTFDVPNSQNYTAGGMDPSSMVMAANAIGHFAFKHIYGFMDLRLKGNKAVREIVVVDNYFNLNGKISANIPYVNESTLSGLIDQCADYTVDFDDEYMVALNNYLHGPLNYTSQPMGRDMTLVCGGVQLNSSYQDFYITLRPGALAKGFQVKVVYTDDDEEIISKFDPEDSAWGYSAYPQYPRGFCIRPGKITSFKATLTH